MPSLYELAGITLNDAGNPVVDVPEDVPDRKACGEALVTERLVLAALDFHRACGAIPARVYAEWTNVERAACRVALERDRAEWFAALATAIHDPDQARRFQRVAEGAAATDVANEERRIRARRELVALARANGATGFVKASGVAGRAVLREFVRGARGEASNAG